MKIRRTFVCRRDNCGLGFWSDLTPPVRLCPKCHHPLVELAPTRVISLDKS